MLQDKQDQALRITCLALKMIVQLFDYQDIKDMVTIDEKLANKINMSFLVKKE